MHTRMKIGTITLNMIAGVSLLVPASVAFTESILLKNGSIIKGSIVQMTETEVTIDTSDMGKVVVKRRTIQSINDGVIPEVQVQQAAANPVPAQAGMPMVINNNNNNNNNNNANAATPIVAMQEKQVTPAIQDTKVQEPADASLLGGQLTFGYSSLDVETVRERRQIGMTESNGLAIHWVPISYRFSNGLTLSAIGDGMLHEGKGARQGSSTRLLHGGGGIGWSSTPPQVGSSGGMWAMNLSYGYGSLTEKYKNTDNGSVSANDAYTDPGPSQGGEGGVTTESQSSINRRNLYSSESIPSSSQDYVGGLAGANIGYTYFASGGTGIQLGGSALIGKLTADTNQGRPEKSIYGFDIEPKKTTKSITTYIGYAGLAYRF